MLLISWNSKIAKCPKEHNFSSHSVSCSSKKFMSNIDFPIFEPSAFLNFVCRWHRTTVICFVCPFKSKFLCHGKLSLFTKSESSCMQNIFLMSPTFITYFKRFFLNWCLSLTTNLQYCMYNTLLVSQAQTVSSCIFEKSFFAHSSAKDSVFKNMYTL
jgi:hypothetical protein